MKARYWEVSYEGRLLMEIWDADERTARQSAVRTYQREGRRRMNLARLEVQ